jgi:hypothetical protein
MQAILAMAGASSSADFPGFGRRLNRDPLEIFADVPIKTSARRIARLPEQAMLTLFEAIWQAAIIFQRRELDVAQSRRIDEQGLRGASPPGQLLFLFKGSACQ